MNAYLFTACATFTELHPPAEARDPRAVYPRAWDGTSTLVVIGGTAEAAEAGFTSWVEKGVAEGSGETQVRAVVAAQFIDQLFTEAGPVALDWAQILPQFANLPEFTPDEEFEKGYWVDVEQAVPPGTVSPDIESLHRELPEDIGSGLNWSAEKQFYFILTVFSQPEPPSEDMGDETIDEIAVVEARQLAVIRDAYPEMADKETVALIQARNSAVAAWLWRKFAVDTPLAGNPIRIDPWCGAMEVERAAG